MPSVVVFASPPGRSGVIDASVIMNSNVVVYWFPHLFAQLSYSSALSDNCRASGVPDTTRGVDLFPRSGCEFLFLIVITIRLVGN